MSDSIRLTTINIDGKNNLDRVLKFIQRKQPDVLCIQEVYKEDLAQFAEIGYRNFYVPMTLFTVNGEPKSIGFATLFKNLSLKVPVVYHEVHHYVGNREDSIRLLDPTTMETRRNTEKRALLFTGVQIHDTIYRIATTHFSWVPKGVPDNYQLEDAVKLISLIRSLGEFVLCGDFNTPRGGSIFIALSNELRDNIPSHHDTSIDPDIHRVKGLRAMVDGVFSTPDYSVSEVELTFGLSDHAAISCCVTKKK